jgi:predicted metal-binding membrane protein
MATAACRVGAHWIALTTSSLAAWWLLSLADRGLLPPGFCSGRILSLAPLSLSLKLALELNRPSTLALGWTLMVAAMMFPLLPRPLQHVRERSFTSRRTRVMLLFIASYLSVWLAAGIGLQPLAIVLRLAIPVPLASVTVAALLALAWQVSPAKQVCLNRCHRQPHLAAFGAAADRDALVFGLTHGASCAGACWALMLVPLVTGRGHLLAMIAISAFILCERLERPGPPTWKWRIPTKVLRIIAAQTRVALPGHSGIGITAARSPPLFSNNDPEQEQNHV